MHFVGSTCKVLKTEDYHFGKHILMLVPFTTLYQPTVFEKVVHTKTGEILDHNLLEDNLHVVRFLSFLGDVAAIFVNNLRNGWYVHSMEPPHHFSSKQVCNSTAEVPSFILRTTLSAIPFVSEGRSVDVQ